MIEDFVRVLRSKLEEDVMAEKHALARGSAKDYAAYQYSCGIVRGMELAEQHIRDLIQAVREADDL